MLRAWPAESDPAAPVTLWVSATSPTEIAALKVVGFSTVTMDCVSVATLTPSGVSAILVGATVTCSVVLAGVRSDWAVEVDEVDGSRINYGWEVVEGSQEIGSDALVEAIGDPFTE